MDDVRGGGNIYVPGFFLPVSHKSHALGMQEGTELVLRQVRVAFHLVAGRADARNVDDFLCIFIYVHMCIFRKYLLYAAHDRSIISSLSHPLLHTHAYTHIRYIPALPSR